MGYTHQHISVLSPQEGYDCLDTQYQSYHSKLSARDKPFLEKYLPRTLQGLDVLDLGGGDGRRAKMYTSAGVHSRTILDISEKLLSRTPAWVSRVQADLLDILPLQDESYDLILCSFVLLHLSALENLFIEARRVIRPKGRMLIFHHQERRPRVHTIEGRPCKIQTRHWTFEQIQEGLERTGRDVDIFPVDGMSKLYCCFPHS